MRARSARFGQSGQWWFFCDHFWDRTRRYEFADDVVVKENRFSKAHQDRDRRRRISALTRSESANPRSEASDQGDVLVA